MKAEELMLGNLIMYKRSRTKFVECTSEHLRHIEEFFKPIPLNDDWFKKLGFKDIYFAKTGEFAQWQNKEVTSFSIYPGMKFTHYSPEIKYVHELQNLFSVITGKKLIIQ